MSNVKVTYVGDGVTNQFGVPFPFLSTSAVNVEVDGVVVPFTFVAPSTVQVSPAPADGATIVIYRNTNIDELNYQFQLGAAFLPQYIDSNNLQLLYATQESQELSREASDLATSVVGVAEEALDKAEEALAATQQAGVSSFNGRGGVVVPAYGDYSAELIPRGASDVDADLSAVESDIAQLQLDLQGYQPADPTLTVLSGVPRVADTFPYFTGPSTAGVSSLTPLARTLLANSTVAGMRATLGIPTAEATMTLTESGLVTGASAYGTARRATVSFWGVATTGTDSIRLVLGTSSAMVLVGYEGQSATFASGGMNLYGNGFTVTTATPSGTYAGSMTLTHCGGNIWVGQGVAARTNQQGTTTFTISTGFIALPDQLDRLELRCTPSTYTSGNAHIYLEY